MNVESMRMMLDATAMRARIAELPAFADVGNWPVEVAALWVKPGRHFNVHYRLESPSGELRRVSAFLLDPAHAARVAEASSTHTCAGRPNAACLACGTCALNESVVLQAFPADYRLPTLGRCLDPESVNRALDGAFDVHSATLRAYRPGTRCQIRFVAGDDRAAYGKVSFERRGAGHALETHRKLHSALGRSVGTIEIARPIAYVGDLRLSLVDELDGTSFHDLASAGERPVVHAGGAARALGALHAVTGIDLDRAFTASDEADLVSDWSRFTGVLFPVLRPRLEHAERKIRATMPAAAESSAVLHRDFHDKQVLCREGRASALLDMDTAASGDRELDVANFSAHLRLRSIQHGRGDDYRALDSAFTDAYPGRLDSKRLGWYRTTTLVRLACSYALRPQWRDVATSVLELASEG